MGNPARRMVLFGALLALLGSTPALALDLDGAKAGGQVGEQADGYVGLVSGDAPAEVKALVERINSGRRREYARIAKKNDIPVEAVAAQAGAKLVERAPAGTYVRDGGGWRRK